MRRAIFDHLRSAEQTSKPPGEGNKIIQVQTGYNARHTHNDKLAKYQGANSEDLISKTIAVVKELLFHSR